MRIRRLVSLSITLASTVSLLAGCAFFTQQTYYPGDKASVINPTKPYVGMYGLKEVHSIPAFEQKTGVNVTSLLVFRSFGNNPTFKTGEFDMLKKQGVVPMISLEPWDPNKPSTWADYSLANIAAGKYDTILTSWAQGVAKYKTQVMIRFAHEMNGPWYPWGIGVSGNTPEQYIAAWRHVVDVFNANGATNATWVWSPNIVRSTATYKVSQFYPGDAYVDIMGLVGYSTVATDTYSSVFGRTLSQLEALSKKPIIFTETGVDQNLPTATSWIKSFFANITKDKRIIGFEWFDAHKRRNWTIAKGAPAQAFADGVYKFISRSQK